VVRRDEAQLGERLRRLQGELDRLRRSRRVLMDVLVALEEAYRLQLASLRAENRRLRRALRRRRQ
jgi:uncharacterized protein involved in exopolysaccharide biosynthesis